MEPTITTDQLATLGTIAGKLKALGLDVKPTLNVSVGPLLSVYRFVPSGTTKFSQLERLGTDLAIVLGVEDVLVKRLPGEASVAVFVPNATRTVVNFQATLNESYRIAQAGLMHVPLNFGVDYLGKPFVEDLVNQPHILIAGSTNSGKSTLLSSMIATLMTTKKPSEIQFVLIDLKQVEFEHFVGAPHLVFMPATALAKAHEYIDYCVEERNRRQSLFKSLRIRNIFEYHALLDPKLSPLPFIVIVIDELAKLFEDKSKPEKDKPTIAKQIEAKLQSLAAESRSAGLYLVAATQRPSAKILAGDIKANFPARLSFRLPSDTDSRTVLDMNGAEHLLSPGDMLYVSPNRPDFVRLHAPFVKLTDIDAAVAYAVQSNH